jgi:hypothetical protein
MKVNPELSLVPVNVPDNHLGNSAHYSHLHNPMLFFLSYLSLTDICLSISIVLKMLIDITEQSQCIFTKDNIVTPCYVICFPGMLCFPINDLRQLC